MIQRFVTAASNFAVVVLNGLAERIERAARKVATAEERANRRPTPAAFKVNKEIKAADLKKGRVPKSASTEALKKLNENLSKNNQHHTPTGRHN